MIRLTIISIVLSLTSWNAFPQSHSEIKKLPEAFYEIRTQQDETIVMQPYTYVLRGERNCIINIAPELRGLKGIRRNPLSKSLALKFKEPVKVLIGLTKDDQADIIKGKLVLKNAVTVSGLPSIHIYTVNYSKGEHTILPYFQHSYLIMGVIKSSTLVQFRDAGLPEGKLWDTFLVDGAYDSKPVFEIIEGPSKPVLDEDMPGTEGILGGFEGGACVKIGDTYHMFPTERAGEKGVEPYYDRVKTRIGYWTSNDAVSWTRQSTIYQASGKYAVTDDDNPLNDRRGAIWSYMPIFNERTNRWNGYYLAYTVHKEIEPNHSFGRIWHCESVKKGIEGIGGPYKDAGIVMEPGLDTQLWEGRQGVDSFYPYPVGDKWLAFYGGAYPFITRSDYPRNGKRGAWYVGLAQAPSLEGPWERMDTTINPVTSIHPSFVENPIVCKLSDNGYITVFDGGPEAWGLHLPNMIGYALSSDGIHWGEARYLPIHIKVEKWWDVMRTPLCLIDEGNDVFTIMYAAIQNNKRFHPMGMVKVKINHTVLEERLNDLK